MRSTLRTTLTTALLVCLALACTMEAHAQIIRANRTLYARIGTGTSVSETDVSTYAVEPFSFNGEVGYQFSPRLSMGLGLTYADYPKANFRNTTMTTMQGLMRWTLFSKRPLSPYAHLGPQLTVGGDNPAFGAAAGLGVDYVVSRRVSFFAEVSAYTTFPDHAIDSRDDGRAAFDGLGFWGAGVRSTLKPAPTPVALNPIEGPGQLYRNEEGTFTVVPNDDAELPIRYEWTFGDGYTAEGLVVDHAYRLEGTYDVTVKAINAGGVSKQTYTVDVAEPSAPARILALDSDQTTVYTHEMVRFNADLKGTSPLDVTWHFGDGTAPAQERELHAYDSDRYIGTLETRTTQGYMFDRPGVYTVMLEAANPNGRDQRAITITVEDNPRTLLASQPLDPCLQPTTADTVFFSFDQAALSTDAKAALQKKVGHLQQCPDLLVRVEAFADSVGPHAYNDELSYRRAEAVEAFYAEHGVDAARFILRGNGEINTPCPGAADGKGCAAHRRAESVIVFRDSQQLFTQRRKQPALAARPEASPQNARMVNTSTSPSPTPWTIIVGSATSSDDARDLAQTFRTMFKGAQPIHIVTGTHEGEVRYRVGIGRFDTQGDAESARDRLGNQLPSDAWPLRIGDKEAQEFVVDAR